MSEPKYCDDCCNYDREHMDMGGMADCLITNVLTYAGSVCDKCPYYNVPKERTLILPCKVGDTVYIIVRGIVEETKVRTFFIGHPSYNRGEPDPKYEMIRCTNFDLPLKDFGKTVFLTPEEAEKALKERDT